MEQAKKPKSSIRNKIITGFFLVILFVGISITLILQKTLETTLASKGLNPIVSKEIISSFVMASAGISISAIILAVIIAYMLSQGISRPVMELQRFVEEVSKGNLHAPLSVHSDDELQTLAESFKNMSREIESSREELVKAERKKAKSLQKLVDKATKKLQERIEKEEKTTKAMIYILERAKRTNEELKQSKEALQRRQEELKEAKRVIEKFNQQLEQKVKERTSELEKAKDRIQHLLDVKTRFVNQVAHDLRTPLTPIMALLPLIKKNIKNQDDVEKVNVVLGNANYLSAIVRDTLNIARIDSGTTTFNPKPENIYDIVNSVIKNNSVVFKEKQVKAKNKVSKNLPPVFVDRVKILEVFENLLMNATKFMQDRNKKELTFDASASGKFVTVKVKDTGEGIPKELLKRIFDEFFKLDVSRHEHSSGLGLSICKRIVEKHGGRIWARSPGQGKGSTFLFTLPIYNSRRGGKNGN